MKGKTSTGFKYEVDDKIRTDWRFTLALADMDSGDESRALQGSVSVVRMLLGKQEQAFYDHIADEDGHIDIQKVFLGVGEILRAMQEKKS